jgi:hypothetical protein
MKAMRTGQLVSSIYIAVFSVVAVAAAAPSKQPASIKVSSAAAAQSLYIVQAATMSSARQSVDRVDAKVERELAIIHAVSAYLTRDQADQLRMSGGVHLFEDRLVTTRGSLLSSLTTSVVSPVATLTSPLVSTVGTVAAPVLWPR